MKFCATRFDSRVPGEGAWGDERICPGGRARHAPAQLHGFLEACEFRRRWRNCVDLVAGQRVHERAAPWSAIREDRARAAVACASASTSCTFSAISAGRSFPISRAKCISDHVCAPHHSWPDEAMREFLDQLDAECRFAHRSCLSPRSPTNTLPNGSSVSRERRQSNVNSILFSCHSRESGNSEVRG